MKPIFALLAATLLLAACGTTSAPKMPERYSGRSAAFRDGYDSGCGYGRAEAAGLKNDGSRNEKRIQSEPDYANGWYDGFEWCRDDYRPTASDRRGDPTKPVHSEGGY